MSRRVRGSGSASASSSLQHRGGADSPIDIDELTEQQPPPQHLVQQLKSMLGAVSEARCADLLLGADLDVERAVNHHFEAMESSSAPKVAATSARKASPSPPPKAPRARSPSKSAAASAPPKPASSVFSRKRALPSLAAPASLASVAPPPKPTPAPKGSFISASTALANGTASGMSDDDDFTPVERARYSRAAKPTSFKKKRKAKSSKSKAKGSKTKGKRKRNDDESDESEESEEDEDSDEEDDDEDASEDASEASDSDEPDSPKSRPKGGVNAARAASQERLAEMRKEMAKDLSSSSSDDDMSDGSSPAAVYRRGAWGRGRVRGGAAAARRALAAAAAAGGGGMMMGLQPADPFARRRRGGGGGGRRAMGRGGRVATAELKRANASIVTRESVQQEEDDHDKERLSKVLLWPGPPPALNLAAAGVVFPDRLAERAKWRVGTIIDASLNDGRGWCRASIVNIVAAPRTFALCYDISFGHRRCDVLSDARFRFSTTDTQHLQPIYAESEPRWEQRDEAEAERAKEREDQRAAAVRAGRQVKYRTQDFTPRQLVDVHVGTRWFLGMVTKNAFVKVGEELEDVVDVQLCDFHKDCTRRYTQSMLHRLDPIAHSHPITHYPMSALPVIRDRDIDITSVYAGKAAGFHWSNDGIGGAVAADADEEEGVERAKPPEPDEIVAGAAALGEQEMSADASAAAASSSSAAAAAAASPSSPARRRGAAAAASAGSASAASAAAASSSSAAAAAMDALAAGPPPMRILGRFSVLVVSDVEYKAAALSKKPMEMMDKRERFAERCFPLAPEDPLLTKLKNHEGEEQRVRRLKVLLQNLSGVSYLTSELIAEPVQIGLGGHAGLFPRAAAHTKAQTAVEEKYKKQIRTQLSNRLLRSLGVSELKIARMKHLQQRLNEIHEAQAAGRAAAKAAGDEDFDVSAVRAPMTLPPEDDDRDGAAAAKPSSASGSVDKSDPTMTSALAELREKQKKVDDERVAKRLRHAGVALDGFLRYYKLTLVVSLVRGDAKLPKKTSEAASSLNELMLVLFPHSHELQEASAAAVAPLPDYLPSSLSLDGLLKLSAHHHHDAADKEIAVDEARAEAAAAAAAAGGGAAAAAAAAADPVDPFLMTPEQLSRAAGLAPGITLKDYQCQTVRWMLRAESAERNVSQPFWCELQMEDGCKFHYSPTLQRFWFGPLPDIKGGMIAEQMGLGKTIGPPSARNYMLWRAGERSLALLNLKAKEDADSAMREAQAAAAANPAAVEKIAKYKRRSYADDEEDDAPDIPVVRDANSAYVSRATLICCPVSLISQSDEELHTWVTELREKSARPLRVLSYHGKRATDPRLLLDHDIVITAYSILSIESSLISARALAVCMKTPWLYEGKGGLSYASPLAQVHWRRVVLDEGHSVKNAAAECSQQATKLLARNRYLMSGTPFGTSLMDVRGQAKFLGITGCTGSFLYTELARFMMSQGRYADLAKKVRADDVEGVPYRTGQWLTRFRNIFTTLVTRAMVRHEKSLLFRGRATLLVLPDARVEVVRVQLTPTQRAAYKLLYDFACKRFKVFKESGDAVRKTIEILQLLVPLRQACSVDTVNIDEVKQRLRDIARGIAVGGPAMGAAAAPSEGFPQATDPAFGSLADECTVCLELLEDAVQTNCRHLYCKECILALCESKGVDAVCPMCRAPVATNKLFAPLVLPTAEELEKQAADEAKRAEAESKSAAAEDADGDERKDADGDESMEPAAAAAAASSKPAPKKRRRLDDGEERKGGSDDEEQEADGEDAANGDGDGDANSAAAADPDAVDPETLSGNIEFDSKLTALLSELRAMKEADPTAKALVFTQFRNSMIRIEQALKQADIRLETLQGHFTLNQRRRALENFKSDPDTTVFLLSVRAAAAGLTLTSANFVFIVEPGFNPAVTLQAINRVWRMGQNKQVNVRYLVCADTVEETILTIAREKMSKRGGGAGDDESGESGALSLLPEIAGSSAAASAKATAAAAAEEASRASAAAAAPANKWAPAAAAAGVDDDEEAAGGRRGRNHRGEARGGRGMVIGNATNDAPDLRLGELERLFAV